MKPAEALDELVEYIQEIHDFCIKKKFHKDLSIKLRFIAQHVPKEDIIITRELLDELESSDNFLEFLIFEEKISGKSP